MQRRCFLLAAALCLAALPVQAAKLVSPLDRIVVQDKTLRVHGTAPLGSTVPIRVESAGKAGEAEVRLDRSPLFEVAVPLSPGLNRLSVDGEEREIFLETPGHPAPAGFSSQRVHGGDLSRCSDCHEADMGLREGGYPNVCLTCHVVTSANPEAPGGPDRDLHFRANIARCNRCHEPHAAKDRKLLLGDSQALCGECHETYRGSDETHAAYEEGGCTVCHDPHFSGFPNLLAGKTATVCQECHDQGTGSGPQHAPLAQGRSCAGCHDPHGSKPALLTSAPAQQCRACHDQVLGAGHGEDLKECAGCHDPHGRPGTGLARGNLAERCAECHDGVETGKTVHAALETGCQACHDPHRDDNLARARTSCGTCHDLAKDRELASLHGDLDLPAQTCSGCHPAHAAPGDQLVRAPLHYPLTQGKCATCHGKGAERDLRPAGVAQRCRMCHLFEKDMERKGEAIHEPVADGECTTCHDPHMSARRGLLRAAEAEACRECHDLPAETAGRSLHPAVETCSDCHRPHGGGTGKFLAAPARTLCTECHDAPAGAEEHAALEEGCLYCHDPHAGFDAASLRRPQRELCLDCHDDPVEGGSVAHRAGAQPCSACHEPHASDGPHLLRSESSASRSRPGSEFGQTSP